MKIRRSIHRVIRSLTPRVREQRRRERATADKIVSLIEEGRVGDARTVVDEYLTDQAARDGFPRHAPGRDPAGEVIEGIHARTAGLRR